MSWESYLQQKAGIRIAFTGAPGSGKTTTAEAIRLKAGIKVVDETATRLLLQYQDEPNAVEKMIRTVKNIQIDDMAPVCTELEIFDRTLIDSLIYDDYFSNGMHTVSDQMIVERDQMLGKYRFSKHAFLFAISDKKEDYHQTNSTGKVVRFQTYEEACQLESRFETGYRALGYRVQVIPWIKPEIRTHMVLCRIREVFEASLDVNSFPNFELHRFATGMNDEGGRIKDCIDKTRQVWTNLSVVLDRPFCDGIDFDGLRQIKKSCGYGIKEEAIDDFNEKQVNLAYACIMNHYIKNAHIIAKKQAIEPVTILLHCFRGGDGPKQLELFEKILDIGCPTFLKKRFSAETTDFEGEAFRYSFPDQNVTMVFTYGKADLDPTISVYTKIKSSKTFASADIILTFSVHVGLKPEWGSGTLVIPNKWTPIDVERMEIQTGRMYEGDNHLIGAITEIVKNPEEQMPCIERINKLFQSLNVTKKNQYARPLQKDDFKIGDFIELGGHIFTPESPKHRSFRINQ